MSEWLKETGCKPVGYAFAGSNPAPATNTAPGRLKPARYAAERALLAQLVEHFHGKEGVSGSSPEEGLAL